jgi:hypothetical protein
MLKILRKGNELNLNGCNYFKDYTSMFRLEDDNCLFNYGIKDIDVIRGGFYRRELVVGLGSYKGKKSWSVVHLGIEALMCGLKVLHISHENSREETEERYDRMSGGLFGRKEKRTEVPFYCFDWDEKKVKTRMVKSESVLNIGRRQKARKVRRGITSKRGRQRGAQQAGCKKKLKKMNLAIFKLQILLLSLTSLINWC